MRAAVYNRYWTTMGGGERYAGKLAQAIATDGWKTDLIGHDQIDIDQLGAHLDLDLSNVAMRVIPDMEEESLVGLSAEYDLFVTATYMSRLAPRARRNIYVCFFPTPIEFGSPTPLRLMLRALRPALRAVPPEGQLMRGWHAPEWTIGRRWIWTKGHGILALNPGPSRVVSATVRRFNLPSAELRVLDEEGRELACVEVGRRPKRISLTVPPLPNGGELRLISPTSVTGGDGRSLGVAVSGLRVIAEGAWNRRIIQRIPWLSLYPSEVSHLPAYDRVIAISEYTAGWIRRYWHHDAEIVFPPIRLEELKPEAKRRKIICAVGRFFAPGLGHSKRQLEMVQIFRRCVETEKLKGWEFHVVGGCHPHHEHYLNEVRRASVGFPIHIRPNASRSLVSDLLSSASIFWSATGLGEDERRRPWAMEHFGITTVEAMAGGCVPVVIDKGGQREIVRDGVDGFRWQTVKQLLERTILVAQDQTLRARLAAQAISRASEFSDEVFTKRWRDVIGMPNSAEA